MLGGYSVDFDQPWWLLLLLGLPWLWWVSRRSLAGLGAWRRWFALGLRTMVALLLILAMAQCRWQRISDRLTVIYLLDQSLSIPAAQRQGMKEYVNRAVDEHRKREDRAGVIVFGRDAAIEMPPIDESIPLPTATESLLDAEYTNLSAAMRLAQATFPEDAARRIVIVSDGNENLGSALEQARGLVDASIGIDVVPIRYRRRAEVSVEKLAVPPEIRKGQPFDLRVVIENSAEPTPEDDGSVSGRLVVTQRTENEPVVISDQPLTLAPGRHPLSLRQELDATGAYSYEARFVPDRPEDDSLTQNNRATGFTQIRGSGQVLLIEDVEHRGEFDILAQRLREQNLEVTIQPSDQLFTALPELQAFDTVLLANVPREDFSEQQLKILVRNTEQLGCGLVMLGGPNSFGAGGWTNSDIEKAMPVDFQINNAKVAPRGALAMIMHASEMPDGNYWQKVIAQQALKALGNEDYCGVLHWDGTEQWLWNQPVGMRKVGEARQKMLAFLDRMVPGDMPDFDPSLIKARKSLASLADAAVKHIVVISDGDPTPPSPGVIQSLVAAKITVSTVAVASHGPAGSQVLQQLATSTKGKYYEVRNPKALPRIFQREARRVASPLIYEQAAPWQPRITTDHEMVRGLDLDLPPIKGFVLTTVKQNPLVEVSIVSPKPGAIENCTILAGWTYGVGRAAVWTTDVGSRWAADWPAWAGYDKLMSQIVRWSMRPVDEENRYMLATDVRDGRVQVVVTSLDAEDPAAALDMQGTVVGPDMQPLDLKLEQTGPGRYVGSFPAGDAGSYFVMVQPGGRSAALRAGVTVPYSAEFRSRTTNEPLLKTLASLVPIGGEAGMLIEPADRQNLDAAPPNIDSFRHDLPPARNGQVIWYLLCFWAATLYFADVFVRRVHVQFGWLAVLAQRIAARLLRRTPNEAPSVHLDRLRARKAEVAQALDERRAATRFEPSATLEATPGTNERPPGAEPAAPGAGEPPSSAPGLAPEAKQAEESYTERLLKAKRRVWDDPKRE